MASESPILSRRLRRLQKELEVGNAVALDAFWQEIGQQGTPLIESFADENNYSLVTFLWRAEQEEQSAEVVSNLSERDAADAMTRLPETDLWYKCYKVHNKTRDSYQFAVAADNVTDPLNPWQHVFPGDEEIGFTGWVSSVLEMPDAPPQPWTDPRPDVPMGQVVPHHIRSETLDEEYRVWVYTPPGYTEDGTPYGFLLILDGWFYIHLVPTHTILDNLLADGLVPPLAAIMVGHPFSNTRGRDLACHPPFADFLTKELVPWARRNYHLSDNPGHSSVVGTSRGGLMAAYMGLQHSEIFSNVISQSGFFGWMPEGDHEEEWLIRQYVTSPRLPLSFYLDIGALEIEMDPGDLTCMLSANRHMRDVLQAKGYPVHYSEFYGGHNPMNWQGTMANALLALYGNSTGDNDE